MKIKCLKMLSILVLLVNSALAHGNNEIQSDQPISAEDVGKKVSLSAEDQKIKLENRVEVETLEEFGNLPENKIAIIPEHSELAADVKEFMKQDNLIQTMLTVGSASGVIWFIDQVKGKPITFIRTNIGKVFSHGTDIPLQAVITGVLVGGAYWMIKKALAPKVVKRTKKESKSKPNP